MTETTQTSLSHEQAKELALDLMQQHGLTEDGWQFKWSNAKRQLGRASIRRKKQHHFGPVVEIKTISISRHLVELNPASEVRETILHEIAHALAGLEHRHDEVWKATCRQIGAKPQRLADEQVRTVKPRYIVRCGTCNKDLQKRHRRVSPGVLNESYCFHCGPDTMGKLQLVDNG